ncbi:hypothetical protein RchiOBHm_Chr2g0141671 [Rosa chinensis]|uniref:Uncharacterized protein n=1 Tax=Rosa chinensis TaxID=74649 RepID=A0A2P6RXN2_ROSCH|nr:hypothetical protein RchiOBHm_Chr2g0141671 [Rosa chinensis]
MHRLLPVGCCHGVKFRHRLCLCFAVTANWHRGGVSAFRVSNLLFLVLALYNQQKCEVVLRKPKYHWSRLEQGETQVIKIKSMGTDS